MQESAYERRQRKAAERVLKNVVPDVTRLIAVISQYQTPLEDASRIFSRQHQDFLASIAAQAKQATNIAAKFAALKPDIPTLQLDYKSLFPDLSAIQKSLIKPTLPSLELIQDIQRKQFADIIAQARAAMRAAS